ncbi:MAG: 3-dehydroquinate synthase [Candidatus Planktophila sp.]|nr:3-dehydroquinate synthase [Candidatus Planktophila sp.]
MKLITVKAEHEYNVIVDCDWRSQLLTLAKNRTRVGIIHTQSMSSSMQFDCDSEVFYFTVPDGEEAKSLSNLTSLWSWLASAGFTRSDLIVGVGGGAVTDVSGFAAATWLRGIDWVAIPTSIAGMVDASIGGKTGINSEFGKNLIGAFHSPISVLIDTSWLSTLSDRDFCAGMAEVVKCGFIADKAILESITGKNLSALRNDLPTVIGLISAAVSVKAVVVSEDFKESFGREILNYGHTLGHAVEMHSAYSLRHGEAVSIGLVFAAELAHLKGYLSKELVHAHREVLSGLNLPISYPRSAWPELLPMLALDKKSRGTLLRFVAISDVGRCIRIEGVSQSELLAAYERVSS